MMRQNKRWGFIGLIVFSAGAILFVAHFAREDAQAPKDVGLFVPATIPDHTNAPQGASVLRYRMVSVAPQILKSKLAALQTEAPNGQSTLDLPLFDDVAIKMDVTDRQLLNQGSNEPIQVISGGIVGEKYAIATLTIRDGALFAEITLPGRKFRVVPVAPPLHRIDEIDSGSLQDPVNLQQAPLR